MTIFDFYKFITADAWSYAIFLSMMVVCYLFFCFTMSILTDNIGKLIMLIRAPIARRPELGGKSDE